MAAKKSSFIKAEVDILPSKQGNFGEDKDSDSLSGGSNNEDKLVNAEELYSLSNSITQKRSHYFATNVKSLLKHVEQNSINRVVTSNNDGMKDPNLTPEQKKEVYSLMLRAYKCLVYNKESLDAPAQLALNRTSTPGSRRKEGRDTNLLVRLQKIFGVTANQHEEWLREIETTSQLERWLEITIEEATGLFGLEQGLAGETINPHCKFGLFSRYEAFRAGSKNHTPTNWDACESICITNVRHNTLNPKWRDMFKIPLIPERDLVVVEVWNQQDPTQDRAGTTQSARCMGIGKKKKENNQYIGRARLDLSKLTDDKGTTVLDLHSPNNKYIRGKIQITTQVLTVSHDDGIEYLRQSGRGLKLYQKIMLEWGRYQIYSGKSVEEGSLPEPYCSLLKKVAELLQLSEFQTTIGAWPFYTYYLVPYSYTREPLNMGLLILSSLWEDEVPKLPEEHITDALQELMHNYKSDLTVLSKTRTLFPPNNMQSVQNLCNVTKYLGSLFKFLQRLNLLEENANFKEHTIEEIKKDIGSWFKIVMANAQPKFQKSEELDHPNTLADVTQVLAQDLADSLKYYPSAFSKIGINYFEIALQNYDELLNERMKEMFSSLDLLEFIEDDDDDIIDSNISIINERAQCSLALFRLYIGIRDFIAFKQFSSNTSIELTLEKYHSMFKPYVEKWLHTLHTVTQMRTKSIIVNVIPQIVNDQKLRINSSVLDLLQCFEHCHDFYNKLQWPFIEDNFNYALRVAEIIKQLSNTFITSENSKLKKLTHNMLENGSGFDMSENVCIGINNCVFIADYLQQARSLEKWSRLTDCFPLQANSFIENVENIYDRAIEEINQILQTMSHTISEAFQQQFKQFYTGFLSKPDDMDVKKSMYDLLNWLSDVLNSGVETLPTDVCPLVLEEAWGKAISSINIYKEELFRCNKQYNKIFTSLELLQGIFEEKGKLSKEVLNSENFLSLYEFFQLHTIKTTKLTTNYCKHLADYNRTATSEMGSLTFSLVYFTEEEALEINVIKASGLSFLEDCANYKAMVRVSLFPDQNIDTVKTKIFSTGVNPTILQEFKMKIPIELLSKEGVLLQLSINSEASKDCFYGGSAYYPLGEVKQVQGNEKHDDKKREFKPDALTLPFILPIQHEILNILNDRQNDKIAASFLKKLGKLKISEKLYPTTVKPSKRATTPSQKKAKKDKR